MRAPAAVVVACLLSFVASSANAVTSVSLVLWGSPYLYPGGEIILDTIVTSNGGETDFGVLGAIEYDDALFDPNPAGSWQVNLSTVGTAAPGWLTGALTCTTTYCVAFNQIKSLPAATAGLTNFHLARTSFLVDPDFPFAQVIPFHWRTSPSTQRLDWFGLTNAPGVSITVIPEPTTAALLGLGLLGIALAARRPA